MRILLVGPLTRWCVPVPVADAARGFVKSVAGRQTGQVYRIGY